MTTTGGKFVMPDANVVLKGSFTAAEQNYRVKYLDEDTKEEIHTMSDPKAAHFGDVIEGYTEKIDISGYTFVRADDLTVGTAKILMRMISRISIRSHSPMYQQMLIREL